MRLDSLWRKGVILLILALMMAASGDGQEGGAPRVVHEPASARYCYGFWIQRPGQAVESRFLLIDGCSGDTWTLHQGSHQILRWESVPGSSVRLIDGGLEGRVRASHCRGFHAFDIQSNRGLIAYSTRILLDTCSGDSWYLRPAAPVLQDDGGISTAAVRWVLIDREIGS